MKLKCIRIKYKSLLIDRRSRSAALTCSHSIFSLALPNFFLLSLGNWTCVAMSKVLHECYCMVESLKPVNKFVAFCSPKSKLTLEKEKTKKGTIKF